MEAIIELQKALIKNYYLTFIMPYDEGISEINIYSQLVKYKGQDYIEKDFETMENERKYLINDIKSIYNNSVAEVLIKLADYQNETQRKDYLKNIIELLERVVDQLKIDFYIDIPCSRYYLNNGNNEIYSIKPKLTFDEKILKNIPNKIGEETINIIELYLLNGRDNVLSLLTYSLFIIANSFIVFLDKKLFEFITKEQLKTTDQRKINQLTINQIVLLLQEIGFFTHPKIEDASKVKQAKLISSITGLNNKNIKTNIGKLDQSQSSVTTNYQKDIDKINTIIDDLI